ncbi:hypothetical protein [Streptomyces sp. RerS4]|uniref:hypothetical protein n=1 Tax=Streptomyces sp. RerS4 TaxID=2942449 RepID=UPI00201C3990|nr:hypothetical protein [Streptomyces sp. RerS4]UQW99242.1 hypothetical protein M4D82_00820 [Streptomyces sp. RerS4]
MLLWDLEQVEAYRDGMPRPALPGVEDDRDLLDRREVAVVLGVQARSVDAYKTDPRLSEHTVVVGGVEHWPRAAVRAYGAGRGAVSGVVGRPRGSGDMVPRDLLPARIAELLDEDPAVTAARVVDVLGVSTPTAQKALVRARAERIAELMLAEGLDAEEAADRLGYPPAVRRAALKAAQHLHENP